MNGTLTLRLTNTPLRAQIARQAVIALAIRAGMPPLAADRAGSSVGAVVASCSDGDVAIHAQVDAAGAHLELVGGDDAWRREAANTLDAYGASADADRVVLTLERTPLRPV